MKIRTRLNVFYSIYLGIGERGTLPDFMRGRGISCWSWLDLLLTGRNISSNTYSPYGS